MTDCCSLSYSMQRPISVLILYLQYGHKTLSIKLDKEETCRSQNRGITTVTTGDDVLPRFQQSKTSDSKTNSTQYAPSAFLNLLMALLKRLSETQTMRGRVSVTRDLSAPVLQTRRRRETSLISASTRHGRRRTKHYSRHLSLQIT